MEKKKKKLIKELEKKKHTYDYDGEALFVEKVERESLPPVLNLMKY